MEYEHKNETDKIEIEIARLRSRNIEIIKEKSKNDNAIKNLQLRKEKLIFGKVANCGDCRYNIVLDLSIDEKHNVCGHPNAPCTCCHRSCEFFRPDNEITVYMKAHSRYHISPGTKRAFDILFGRDIWESDNCKSDNKESLKKFLEFYFKELNWWRD